MRRALVVFCARGALAGLAALVGCGGDDLATPFCLERDPETGGLPCDDGDPCTEDRCDQVADRCVFVPEDAANACRTDLHCDDHNACTDDACVIDGCGFQRCRHTFANGCQQCEDGLSLGCDDGNDCTVERCVEHACVYESQPLCQYMCGRGQFQSGRFLLAPEWDGYGTAGGVPTPIESATAPCSEAEACTCREDVALGPITASGALRLVATPAVPDLGCRVDTCDAGAPWDCSPLIAGLRYVVWGRGATPGLFPVEGFCLVTSPGNLQGHYRGTLDGGDWQIPLDAAAGYFPPDFGFTFTPGDCGGCGYRIGDPVALFTFAAQSFALDVALEGPDGASHRLHGTMYPNGSALVGNLVDRTLTTTLRLERLPGM
ncbi:MAG: hypothetical protein U1F43_02325 [Myxococcota bacterium]